MSVSLLKRVVLVGIVATVIMTGFSMISQSLSLPSVDFRGMIARHVPTGMLGSWVLCFGIGVFLTYLYVQVFRHRLPAHSWMRGVMYAIFLWMVMGLLFMPLMGMGLFSGSLHAAIGAFMAMATYGATVGYFYREH